MKKDAFFLKNTRNYEIDEIEKEALEIASDCRDYIVESAPANIQFCGDKLIYYSKTGEMKTDSIGSVAFSQLCHYAGVPSKYAERLIDAGKADLFALNMNEGIKENSIDSTVLVREYGDKVRGFLSSKFSPFDSYEVITNMKREMDFKNFDIKGYGLNENYFHMRLVDKNMMQIDGEDLFPGISVSTSDVGAGALNISYFIYKKVCSNGLVVSQAGCKLLHMRHMGITKENFLEELIKTASLLPDMSERMTDVVVSNSKIILSSEELEAMIKKLEKEIPALKKENGKLMEFTKKYQTGEDISRWNLINGITEAAQQFDLQKRLQIEEYAGKLLMAA